jgi:hypothetical protein
MVMKPRIENDFLIVAKPSELEAYRGRCELHAHRPRKEEHMKKLIAVLALCLAASVPSFGAEHVVTRSAKAVGKGTYKVAKLSVKGTAKFVKFMF